MNHYIYIAYILAEICVDKIDVCKEVKPEEAHVFCSVPWSTENCPKLCGKCKTGKFFIKLAIKLTNIYFVLPNNVRVLSNETRK